MLYKLREQDCIAIQGLTTKYESTPPASVRGPLTGSVGIDFHVISATVLTSRRNPVLMAIQCLRYTLGAAKAIVAAMVIMHIPQVGSKMCAGFASGPGSALRNILLVIAAVKAQNSIMFRVKTLPTLLGKSR